MKKKSKKTNSTNQYNLNDSVCDPSFVNTGYPICSWTAWNQIPGWNSPCCGACLKISWRAYHTYVTATDAQASPTEGLDLAPEAFYCLTGSKTQGAVQPQVTWKVVDAKNCPGNKGNTTSQQCTVTGSGTTGASPATPFPSYPAGKEQEFTCTNSNIPILQNPESPDMCPGQHQPKGCRWSGLGCSDGAEGLITRWGYSDLDYTINKKNS